VQQVVDAGAHRNHQAVPSSLTGSSIGSPAASLQNSALMKAETRPAPSPGRATTPGRRSALNAWASCRDAVRAVAPSAPCRPPTAAARRRS
jgi:hypothetical protein